MNWSLRPASTECRLLGTRRRSRRRHTDRQTERPSDGRDVVILCITAVVVVLLAFDDSFAATSPSEARVSPSDSA